MVVVQKFHKLTVKVLEFEGNRCGHLPECLLTTNTLMCPHTHTHTRVWRKLICYVLVFGLTLCGVNAEKQTGRLCVQDEKKLDYTVSVIQYIVRHENARPDSIKEWAKIKHTYSSKEAINIIDYQPLLPCLSVTSYVQTGYMQVTLIANIIIYNYY